MRDDERVTRWLEALEQRQLADLTPSEVARAFRALSSCYVERRAKLARGGARETAGKRAAFTLFYAPLHFFVVRDRPALEHAQSEGSIARSRPRVRDRRGRRRMGAGMRPLRDQRRRSPRVGGRGSELDVSHAWGRGTREAGRSRPPCGARRKRTGDYRGLHRQRAAGYHARGLAAAPDRRARAGLPDPDRRTDSATHRPLVAGLGKRVHGLRRPARTSGGSPRRCPNGRGSSARPRGSIPAS